MGTGRGLLDLLWTVVIAVYITPQAETHQERVIYGNEHLPKYDYETHQERVTYGDEHLPKYDYDNLMALAEPSPTPRMTFIPTGTIIPYASALNPSHNGQVCSTWGSFHYKTFDGDIFQFPGLCNYVFASHCQAAYEDFNIQIRRSLVGETPTISRILIKTEGVVLELSPTSILINGQREQLPYSRAGFTVEASSPYIKVSMRMVLTFLWNGDDSVLLELDTKYANQTCGLCGDFNGLSTFNEFYSNNVRLTTWQFGNLQKLDGPNEQCQDPMSSPVNNCTDEENSCLRVLTGLAFSGCNQLVDPRPYMEACVQDLCGCREANRSTCVCATFSEYSRQCAHSGGQPLNWRNQDLCYKTCPSNLQHHECGSPCVDTCSNPERSQLCEEHCIDGCFCPPGTVLDDIQGRGCVTLDQCHCTYNGQIYKPGDSFSTRCSSCTCLSGLWQCEELPCPGTCSVEGGSHITTFDQKRYNVHGDCSYVLSKKCEDTTFTILGELRRCGLTDNENCLKSVTLNLNGGETVIRIQPNGGVFVNSIYTQLPISAANIIVFQPSTHFVLVHTAFGLLLQIQLVPLMQVSVRLDPSFRGQMCGLCGNFNQNQADDFAAISGVVEGTGAAFANTWKTQADCANVRNSFENPCSLSVENENYAQHWCSLLTDPSTAFSQCHAFVNPAPFYKNCMFDTCNCEKSEDCLCAALSSYVLACAAQGVLLSGWRTGVCTKYMTSCRSSLTYSYVVESCQPTCRSLSEPDVTCSVQFNPVDGCVCANGTYLNDAGQCVPASQCPCYYKGTMVALGETVQENGAVCSCTSGKLSCFGVMDPNPVCISPMIYLDCNNASALGTLGAQCQKSCDTLDVACYNTQCVSGCICPSGLVKDGNNGCIKEEDCPCVHNEAAYKSGESIRVDCNTCTCKNRRWECTQDPCLGTCAVYGDGHFITFDSERYNFEGNCEYTLAQDYCGGNTTTDGTFRVITENIPCGTTGVTCSKAIKVFLKGTELIFSEGKVKMVERGPDKEVLYKIHSRGIYMVLETQPGLVLMWDRKTSIFIKLHQHYKGKVCGLCGNYDGNSVNDFTTRSLSVVGDVQEFGNSWKISPTCPDASLTRDPCTANPYRKAWAQKQCSIINSAVFTVCHPQVDSTKYYEACVSDACACDSGGDCECFCTAVAAYAQACNDVGVCISWRKPDICPMFCDFYNPQGECDWHYQPCGAPCLKTCRNPSGKCLVNLPGLEGCYPNCPAEKPFFSENQMKCVEQCGCYDENENYYEVGDKVVSQDNCQSCICTTSGIQCTYDQNECTCVYEGRTYHFHEVIYNTTDGLGACLIAICGENGEIKRSSKECPVTPSTTAPFTFTTSTSPEPTAGPATTTSVASTVCVQEACEWSDWYDSSTPGEGLESGDFETFENLRLSGYQICSTAHAVECRARAFPNASLGEVGQKVECSLSRGLVCYNADQDPPLCNDYEIRVLCCSYRPCGGVTATSSPPVTRSTTIGVTSSVPPTVSTVPCQPRCQWTEWFDTDYPKSEALGGDIETYDRIRNMGKDFCQVPQGIECQAENYPNMTIEEVGQVVLCDVHFGFICRNADQQGLFKMCNNYKIRVLCCDDSHCHERTSAIPPASTPQPSTIVGTGTTASSLATTTTQKSTPITLLTTETRVLTTAPSPAASSSAPPPPTATTSNPQTTSAVPMSTPAVTTTKMIEVTTTATSTPSQTPVETTSSLPIHPSTEATQTTQRPSQTPETTSLATTILVTGSSSVNTATQEPTSITLLSTPEIRVLTTTPATSASSSASPPPTTTTSNTQRTSVVSTSKPMATTTKMVEVTTIATSTPSQTPVETASSPPIHPSTEATQTTQRPSQTPETTSLATTILVTGSSSANTATQEPTSITLLSTPEIRVLTTTPVTSASSSASLPLTTTTSNTQRTSVVSTSKPMATTTKMVEVTTVATSRTNEVTVKSTNSPPSHSSTKVIQTTEKQTSNSATSTATIKPTTALTTTLGPPGPTTTIATISPHVTTRISTSCQPKCEWTEWFDVDFPISGISGGDFETYANIRKAGGKMCHDPKKLECRAENYPEVSIDQIGQVLQCNLEFGLICRNGDQKGKFNMCFNYNIRVLCCDDYTGCPSIVVGTTTTQKGSSSPSKATETTETLSTSQSTIQKLTTFTSTLVTSTKEAISTPPSVSVTVKNETQTPPKSLGTTWKFTSTKPLTAPLITISITPGQSTTARTFLTESTTARPSIFPTSGTTEVTKLPKTTLGSQGTSPLFGITSTSQTTTFRPNSSGTTMATSATGCQPRCLWTDWFDQSYPIPGEDGGDFETYANIRAAGGALCDKPQEIQCRAENYEDMDIDQVGQVVECDVNNGLICRNKDQSGKFKMCLNYHIKVLCCDDYRHCTTTPSSTLTIISTSTTQKVTSSKSSLTSTNKTPSVSTTHSSETTRTHPWSSTASGGTTLSLSPTPSNTVTSSMPASTGLTSPGRPFIISTVTSPSTSCTPICMWTDWFDESYPIPGEDGGDFETYANIRAAGGALCDKPEEIQCRAENYEDMGIDQVGQVVECDVNNGLICRNKAQSGKFKMCLNYHIKVLCCDYTRCETTATPRTTPYRSTPSTVETASTPMLSTLITIPSTTSTSNTMLTTHCAPRCRWTEWFDTDEPSPGRFEGDIETYYSIMDAGNKICLDPTAIECQASLYPDAPLDQLGQVVWCDVDYGLICRNSKQKDSETMCLNYRIRVQCCDDYSHCGITPSPVSTTSTASTSWTTPTSSITTMAASSRPLGTSPQISSLKTKTTTPTPATQGSTKTVTSSVTLTSLQSTSPITSPITPPSGQTTAGTSPGESTTERPNTFPTSGSTEVTTLTKTTSGSPGISFSFGTTSTSQTTTFRPNSSGTTIATSATGCQPRCLWTDWFDQSYPIPGEDGGDFETYANIRAAGGALCDKPQEIQCRAENYEDMDIDQVEQVVECDVNNGLICRNKDQSGKFKMCLNYHIKVLCCDDYRHCTTTPSSTLTIISTSTTQKVTSSKSSLTSTNKTPSVSTTHSSETTRTHPWSSTASGGTTLSLSPTPSNTVTSSMPASTGLTSPGRPFIISTVTSPSTSCTPICMWTDWFDESYPIPGEDGGDFETYANIRAAGGALCDKPEEIQCRAENYEDMGIDQVGQVVECDVNNGLICRNKAQSGKFKMCLNYHIKVLCCDYTRCETTATPRTTPYRSTPSTVETASTPMLSTLITIPSTTSTSNTMLTTHCAPRCRWTEWFDTDEPSPGRFEGDIETYYSIMDAGNKICLDPTAIECQASLYPDAPLDQLGQVVWCDVDYGLICRNSKQKDSETMCLNYRIRVQCCDDYSHCGITPSPVSTTSTASTSWTTPTSSITTTAASSRPLGTSPQISSLKTKTTTPTPATQGSTKTVTSSVTLTSLQSTSPITSPITPPSGQTTAGTSPGESTTERPNTFPTSGSTEVTTLTKTTSGSPGISFSFGTTSTSQTTTFRPHSSGTTMATSATGCQPRCLWTDWFDQSYPIPGEDGGDFETYDNIRATGKAICQKPMEIECRAEMYQTLPLSQVDQNVQCNVSVGLICRNRDQAGPTKYCLNYHVRVLCCDDYRHCTTSTSTSSTPVTSHLKTTHVSTPTVQTPTLSTFPTFSPPCFCFVSGELFSPGDVIYNKTDKAGCSFFAICNQQCEIERFQGPCPTPTSSVSSSTVPQTTPPPGCYDVIPPRQPGEQWTSNCQDCICDNSSLTVQCRPVQCPEPTLPPKCQKDGFVVVYRPWTEDSCCVEAHCVCNQSSCPQDQPSCKPQEELFNILPKEDCCPVFGCRERTCEHNGTTYGIGSTVPSDQPCHTCTCGIKVNPETNSTVWCEAEHCSVTCAPDEEYTLIPGQCCGKCVQSTCLTPDGKWLKVNETWVNSSVDFCMEFFCEKLVEQPILIQRPIECPDLPPCKGVIRKVGCCFECEEFEENCRVQSNETLLQYEGCVSEAAVNLTFCTGACQSTSMYSQEANEMQRKCTCCQETRVHQEEVKLKCPDGSEIQHSYTHVDACGCTPACLPSHAEVFS